MNDRSETTTGSSRVVRWILLAVVVAVAGGAYFTFRDQLTLAALAEREQALREYRERSPVLSVVIAFAVYVGVTGLSLPGATPLTLLYGWFFGFWSALVLVSFASTTGATIAFLLARFLLRDTFRRRFGDRIRAFEENLEREGAFYLFTLRLIPAVPFFVVNVAMGLTPLAARTFWWVSQVGMLPGTAVYVFAGSTISLERLALGDGPTFGWDLVAAFVLLGLFPLAVRRALRAFGHHPAETEVPEESDPPPAGED